MSSERERAWDELLAAKPTGWFVGRPSHHPEKGDEWVMYAYDPAERPVAGARKREWTTTSDSEVGIVREMARCRREIGERRVPT